MQGLVILPEPEKFPARQWHSYELFLFVHIESPVFFTIMETISAFIDVCIHHRKQIIMLHKLSVPQNFYSNFSCETHTYQCKDYSLFLNQRSCQHDSCTRMNHYCLYRLKIQSYHNHENLHCIHLHLYLLPWKHNHLGREKQPKLHLFF